MMEDTGPRLFPRFCPSKTDRAPATEIADRPGRSFGAASRQSGEALSSLLPLGNLWVEKATNS